MHGRNHDAGLQPERTHLSWERTAIGFVAIGALVLLRHGGVPFTGRSVVAVIAFTLALAVTLLSRTRLTTVTVSPVVVLTLGYATTALAFAVSLLILSASL